MVYQFKVLGIFDTYLLGSEKRHSNTEYSRPTANEKNGEETVCEHNKVIT